MSKLEIISKKIKNYTLYNPNNPGNGDLKIRKGQEVFINDKKTKEYLESRTEYINGAGNLPIFRCTEGGK